MPIYEYLCESCGTKTEALQKLSDPPLAECPRDGGSLNRILSLSFAHTGSTGGGAAMDCGPSGCGPDMAAMGGCGMGACGMGACGEA